jgi:hypothetical protein
MPASKQARTGTKRRMSLRAAGLRPVRIWVPDTTRPGFADECHRQSMIAARADAADEGLSALMDDLLADLDDKSA